MKRAVEWFLNAWRGQRSPKQVATAYRDTFQTPSGRVVLTDLARYCNVGNSTHVPNDAQAMAINEGQRQVFLHVAEVLGLKATDFPEIVEGDDHG